MLLLPVAESNPTWLEVKAKGSRKRTDGYLYPSKLTEKSVTTLRKKRKKVYLRINKLRKKSRMNQSRKPCGCSGLKKNPGGNQKKPAQTQRNKGKRKGTDTSISICGQGQGCGCNQNFMKKTPSAPTGSSKCNAT